MATSEQLKLVTAERLLELLPHRYPMLLVDRVMDVVPGKSCRGVKCVTINEPFFQGHYPGKPIMPGALILEAMAQAGCVMILMDEKWRGCTPVAVGVENARFRRMVVPGDQLITEVELLWLRAGLGKFRATATVEGQVAAEMEMTFKLMREDE